MELNWKEDSNLIRKLAKILLGDTLPNGKPVSSIILLDDTSRANLQPHNSAVIPSTLMWRMSSNNWKKNTTMIRSCSMICFRFLMQTIWIFGKKSVNGKILTMTSQRNIFSPILTPISSPTHCRLTAPDTISGLTKLDISV